MNIQTNIEFDTLIPPLYPTDEYDNIGEYLDEFSLTTQSRTDAFMNKLNNAPKIKELESTAEELTTLSQHIVNYYHQKHRQDMAWIIPLSRKIEYKFAYYRFCPHGLENFLSTMFEDFERHMQKEELIIFPAIQQGNYAPLQSPMNLIEMEHLTAHSDIQAIKELTHDFFIPKNASEDWQRLIEGVDQFTNDLTEHIHLETDVLFPLVLNSTEQ